MKLESMKVDFKLRSIRGLGMDEQGLKLDQIQVISKFAYDVACPNLFKFQ